MSTPLYSREAAEDTRAPGGYRWVILASAFLLQALYTQLQQGIGILTPFFLRQFSLSLSTVGVLVSAFNAGLMISSLPTGAIVDRVGVRRSLSFGALAVFLLVFAGIFLQRWVAAVGGCLFIAGLLGSAQGVSSSKTVFSWFVRKERGLAMGIRQIAVPVGAGVAAVLLPFLGRQYGWQVPLGAAALLQLAAAGLFLLLWREAAHQPVVQGPPIAIRKALADALRDRDLSFTAATGTLLVMTQYVMLAYLILYLSSLKFDVVVGSTALLMVQVGGMAGRSIWGWVSDRVYATARRPVLQRVAILSAAAVGSLALTRVGTPLWLIYVQAFLIGATCIGWNALLMTMMAEVAGLAKAGVGIGFNSAAVFAGALIAPPLFGAVVDSSHSYRTGFLVVATITLIALIPLSRVRERRDAGELATAGEAVGSHG